MDVSADLTELGRTPIAVVCAGVKSILDIEKTLEYLETQGVTLTTFGETLDFPAFFTQKSGFNSPSCMKTVDECASLIYANLQLRLDSGIVIAVPIPQEHASNANTIQLAIDDALLQAKQRGIRGKDVTPFLLQKVNEQTKGTSLKSNIALVKNNAKIGSQIAKRLAELELLENSPSGIDRKDSIFIPPSLKPIETTRIKDASVKSENKEVLQLT